MRETLTISQLIKCLQNLPQDLLIYNTSLYGLTGIDLVQISERHSKKWFVPQNFAQLKFQSDDMRESGIERRKCTKEENGYFKKGINVREIRFRKNITDKLNELEQKYKEQYGCEIVEMYADIVSDLKDWLNEDE